MPKPDQDQEPNLGIPPQDPNSPKSDEAEEIKFILPALNYALYMDTSGIFTSEDWLAFHTAEQAVLSAMSEEDRTALEKAVNSQVPTPEEKGISKQAIKALLEKLDPKRKVKLARFLSSNAQHKTFSPDPSSKTPSTAQIMKELFLAMLPIALGLIVGTGLHKTKSTSTSVTLLASLLVFSITQSIIALFRNSFEEFAREIELQVTLNNFKNEFENKQKVARQAELKSLKADLESKIDVVEEAVSEFVTEQLDAMKDEIDSIIEQKLTTYIPSNARTTPPLADKKEEEEQNLSSSPNIRRLD